MSLNKNRKGKVLSVSIPLEQVSFAHCGLMFLMVGNGVKRM